MKTCSNPACAEANPQPLSSFHKNKAHPNGINNQCKECRSVYKRSDRYKALERLRDAKPARREKKLASGRAQKYKSNYGITVDQYNEMLLEQNNCCAGCSKNKDNNVIDKRTNKPRALAVDHCHKTGKVRGLLCSACNQALGLLNDSPAILGNLITYLNEVI